MKKNKIETIPIKKNCKIKGRFKKKVPIVRLIKLENIQKKPDNTLEREPFPSNPCILFKKSMKAIMVSNPERQCK